MITPSFTLTATERVLPKLALDFTTASLDSRVTFTRTTGASNPATYVDSNGYVVGATNNQPRFDYDPLTLACKGLLIEESRTNLFLNSEDFSSWTQTAGTASSDVTTSPDGTSNADLFYESIANSTHYLTQTTFFTSGTTYTMSVFSKYARGENRYLRLLFPSAAFTTATYALFDLQTGAINAEVNTPSAKIDSFGDGWYRCSITKTATVTVSSIPQIGLENDTSPGYLGDGYSGNYVWGAQIEAGAFATSYIPTTLLPLTRNADVATMTGHGNVSQGTFTATTTYVSGKTLLTSGSVTFAATASTEQKTSVGYNATSVHRSIDAATVTSTAGATAGADITFGTGGIFKKMALYLNKMTDAELQAFSK